MFALESSTIYLISWWASVFLFYLLMLRTFDILFFGNVVCSERLTLFFKFICLRLYPACSVFFFFFFFKLILTKARIVYLQITNTVTVPEIAFTGDTMSDFIIDQNNIDVLRSRILVMEVHYFAYVILLYIIYFDILVLQGLFLSYYF